MKTFFFLVQKSSERDINVVGNGKGPFCAQKGDHFAFIGQSQLERDAEIHAWQNGKDCCHHFGTDKCPLPRMETRSISSEARGLYWFGVKVDHSLGLSGTNGQLNVGSPGGGHDDGSCQK